MKIILSVKNNATRNGFRMQCIRCVHSSRKSDPPTRYENKSIKQEIQNKHDRQRLARKLIDGRYHQRPSPMPIKSTQFDDIRNAIRSECKTIAEIYRILHSPSAKKHNYDHTVYVCAMKKCETIARNYKPSEGIMKLIYDNGVDRTVIVYNELYKILLKYGKLDIALTYFNYMTKIDTIKPTIITATILIGGCKDTSDYKLASKIWDNTITKYSLQPDHICYTQLISVYAKACKAKLALNAFNEMLGYNILPSITCYGALINCYCKVGEVDNAAKILKLIHGNEQLKHQVSHAQYTPFMSYYLQQNKPIKALKIYDQCIKLMMNKHRQLEQFDQTYLLKDESLQYLRSVIYVQLIKGRFDGRNRDDEDIKEWLRMLFDVLPNERERVFGLNRTNHRLAHQQLQVMLLLYGEYDMKKVIGFFEEELLKNGHFGMWTRHHAKEMEFWVLDLHLMTFDVTKFILKYVFKYEKENILNSQDDEGNIHILCGQGKHRKVRTETGKNHENNITRCVQDELLSWNPHIRSAINADNKSFVTLNTNDIIQFYNVNGDHKLLNML
eukprot:477833_1